ncbi:MAG TPA: hypothetical protein VNQ79_20200 [Blastocatellia bacterium]|nr:hypothetical protein [Blastocatellia bacterium]
MTRSGRKSLTGTRGTTINSSGPKARARQQQPAGRAKAIISNQSNSRNQTRSKSMNTIEETNNHPAAVEAAPGAESLDKVRDILFGVQMRDYEKRFGQLEERLIREAGVLREEVRKRFDSLENFIKSEIEALTDQLKSERDERSSSVRELTRELRDLTKSTEKKDEQFEAQLTRTSRDLRQQILDQSKLLTEEIQTKYSEMTASLSREAQSLRADKTDRTALAGLLTEMAMRLTDDSRPGAGKTVTR